jgi:hypothetical protein
MCYRGYPYSLVLRVYIASLLHSYSKNSVLHLLSLTIRDNMDLPATFGVLSVEITPRASATQSLTFEAIEICKSRGRSRDVVEQCKQLLETRLRLYGKTSPLALQSRAQLGECLEDTGNHLAALTERRVVLEYTRRGKSNDDDPKAIPDVAKSPDRLREYSEA